MTRAGNHVFKLQMVVIVCLSGALTDFCLILIENSFA